MSSYNPIAPPVNNLYDMNWGYANQNPQQIMMPPPVAQPVPNGVPYAGYNAPLDGNLTSIMADTGNSVGGSAGSGGASWWDSLSNGFVGKKNVDGTQTGGWGGLAIGGAQALFNGYLGMQQLSVAKKTLAEGQRQFDMNYGNQRQLTNTRLEDRQRARVASNSGAYESVGNYMAKNGVK